MTIHGALRDDTPTAVRAPGGTAALEIIAATKSYGDVRALDGVTITVGAGQVLALLGPNGAGKSSLLASAAGVRRLDAGEIRVAGHAVGRGALAASGLVGYAPQEIGLYPLCTVAENLRFFGRLAGVVDLDRQVEWLVEALSLGSLLRRRVSRLSGGERRRVHVATALLGPPPLLLLDEPTAGVDAHVRRELLDVVRALAADGHGVLYATHQFDEVEALGADVAIIHRGRIRAHAPVDELRAPAGPAHVRVCFDGVPVDLPVPGWSRVAADVVEVEVDQGAINGVLAALARQQAPVRSLEVVRQTLESVYVRLTSEEGSDAAG